MNRTMSRPVLCGSAPYRSRIGSARGRPALGPDDDIDETAAHLVGEAGRTTFRAWSDLVAPYGRPGLGEVPGMVTVLAVRE